MTSNKRAGDWGCRENDECATAIPFPGDIQAGEVVTGYEFTSHTDSGNPSPTCDFGDDAVAWFSWSAPVISATDDAINLVFDGGTCLLGMEVYETDCVTTASNCLANVNGTITGLLQGTDYVFLIYQDVPLTANTRRQMTWLLVENHTASPWYYFNNISVSIAISQPTSFHM